jgi:HEAT repeat protein
MAAARTFDDKRARIRELASGSESEATAQIELKKLLADKSSYLVGEAAEAVKKLELRALVPDLCAAFGRLLDDPVKNDKGCTGKNHVVEALLSFDAHEPDVYLAGLRHVQKEPAFPEAIDTAAGLRGLCAHALVHIGHRTALLDVAPLLLDPEPVTRAEAAGALGESGMDGAAAALHVKVLAGDKEPDVLGAAYKALLQIAPARYLKVVSAVLQDGRDEEVEAAALALGESRAPGALDLLKDAAREHAASRTADGVLLGIGLLRSDAANAFLLSLVEDAPEAQATKAISALALHRHDEALVEKLRGVVKGRGSRKLTAAFEERFRG